MAVKEEIISASTTVVLNSSYVSSPAYMYQANVSDGAYNTLVWSKRIMSVFYLPIYYIYI